MVKNRSLRCSLQTPLYRSLSIGFNGRSIDVSQITSRHCPGLQAHTYFDCNWDIHTAFWLNFGRWFKWTCRGVLKMFGPDLTMKGNPLKSSFQSSLRNRLLNPRFKTSCPSGKYSFCNLLATPLIMWIKDPRLCLFCFCFISSGLIYNLFIS